MTYGELVFEDDFMGRECGWNGSGELAVGSRGRSNLGRGGG